MSYFRKDIFLIDAIGRAIGGAQVFIGLQPTFYGNVPREDPTPLATIASDNTGTVLANPVVLDGQGNGFYYAQPGFYTEVYVFQGKVKKVLIDQCIGPAEKLADISDVQITSVQNHDVLTYDSTSSKWVNKQPTFVFNQSIPAATWVIIHNLNHHPAVTVTDSTGRVTIGDIVHDSNIQCTVYFQSAFSGIATCI